MRLSICAGLGLALAAGAAGARTAVPAHHMKGELPGLRNGDYDLRMEIWTEAPGQRDNGAGPSMEIYQARVKVVGGSCQLSLDDAAATYPGAHVWLRLAWRPSNGPMAWRVQERESALDLPTDPAAAASLAAN